MKINKITPQELNAFYRSLAEEGTNKKTGKPLSKKTIKEHHNVISKILDVCWRWGAVSENVAKKADPPSPNHVEIDCLNEEEVSDVLKALEIEPDKYKLMITLLILYGFRKGELLGLEWKDIDFKKHRISIRRTSQCVEGKIITKEPKTVKSIRDLTMDFYTEKLLMEYSDWYSYQKEKAGDEWVNSDRLFIKDNGSPMHPDTPGDWWDKFQKRNGMPHHTLHSLRHTNASLLIANNTDVATVAGRLGHASATTTLNIYTHQFPLKDEGAARTLGRIAQNAVWEGDKPSKMVKI